MREHYQIFLCGFKSRGLRIRDDSEPLQPGEFRDVDAPGGNIKDQFQFLPFKGPDSTLYQLLQFCVDSGRRFASIADMKMADMNTQAPVGTTMAVLERGSKVMSAIHKRCYYSMGQEFKMLAGVISESLPMEYPYDVVGASRLIKQSDFDDRVDILPVADPDIYSMTQRIQIAQASLTLAQSNPQMHDIHEAYKRMYQALGVKNISGILKPPPGPPRPLDSCNREYWSFANGNSKSISATRSQCTHCSPHVIYDIKNGADKSTNLWSITRSFDGTRVVTG